MVYILIIAALFLAYSNGSNDIFKSVATLFGSGTTNFKNALSWGVLTSLLGSLAAIFLMSQIVSNFSGIGLVPTQLAETPSFAAAIALAAASTVFIATKIGMPISTTHGLIGSISGAGILAVGSNFNFTLFSSKLLLPLVLSPLIAALFSPLVYKIFSTFRKKFKINREKCICVGKELIPIKEYKNNYDCSVSVQSTTHRTIKVSEMENCREVYQGKFLGIKSDNLVNFSHYLSAGFVGFSRSLNDTQKMVGFLLISSVVNVAYGMIFIGLAMVIGGLLNSRKVGENMSKNITPMNQGQGFSANLVTGGIVSLASTFGLPVSTTHVAVGSIFGIGSVTKKANPSMIKKILYSWILTLPVAFVFGMFFFWLLTSLEQF